MKKQVAATARGNLETAPQTKTEHVLNAFSIKIINIFLKNNISILKAEVIV